MNQRPSITKKGMSVANTKGSKKSKKVIRGTRPRGPSFARKKAAVTSKEASSKSKKISGV